jgi:hypothetical protein
MKNLKLLATMIACMLPLGVAKAEPFIGASLGYSFNSQLSSITANENTAYPGDPTNIYPSVDSFGWSTLYPDAKYSNVKLKDTLSGGIKAGYYFESYPSLGVELEGFYSKPNIKAQNVTITHPGFNNLVTAIDEEFNPSATLDQNHFTENQLGAKVQLFQFNLNGLYRYQGIKGFTPYVGLGPSLNIFKIKGSGISGNFSAPDSIVGPETFIGSQGLADGPNIHQTAVNVGVNFKAGLEFQLNQDWGVGMEYHYAWSPVDVDRFRSAQNLKADYEAHNLSLVLQKHF